MSNYNKSYNFTNGLQVDDSNFVVTANGLVGIGTTVPQKTLDVRGNTQINGGLTATDLNITGIVTVGAGITLDATSGIITATKFVGDASSLTNIVAISTVGLIANAGSLSTTAKLGIGSITPTKQLDVIGDSEFNGDVNISGILTTGEGVRIISGGINAVGVVTATSLVIDDYIYHAGDTNTSFGFESNDTFRVTTNGSDKFQINSSGHLILSDDQDTYIHHPSGGIISVVTGGSERFSVSGTGVTVTGEISATGAIRGTSFSGNGGVPADFSNGLIATASTFTDDVEFHGVSGITSISFDKSDNSLKFVDDAKLKFGSTDGLEIYHSQNLAGTNDSYIDSSARNLYVRLNTGPDNGGNIALQAKKDEHGVLIEDDAGVKLYFNGDLQLETIGAGASVYNELKVASFNGGISGLSSHFGSLRYGGTGGAPYSTRRSLDLTNTDSGNINFYLNANNLSVPVDGSDFHWHKGINNSTLMTLTGIGGSLGIGITTPATPLHVLGAATISGNVVLGGDLDVTGNAALNVIGQVTGNLTGNVFANSGVSTFKRLDLDTSVYYEFGQLSAAAVGIGTTMGTFQLAVNDDADKKFFITDSGNVGIRTDDNFGSELYVSGDVVLREALGVGTTQPNSVVDFSNAGQGLTGAKQNRMFMVPPKVGAAQTAALVSLVAGAMIYNTDLNKLQVYNGNNWETVTSVEA